MLAEFILTKSAELKLYVLVQGLATYSLWPNLAHGIFCMFHKLKTVFTFLKNYKGKRRGRKKREEATDTVCNPR